MKVTQEISRLRAGAIPLSVDCSALPLYLKAANSNKQTNTQISVLIKLYVQKQTEGQIWSVGFLLLACLTSHIASAFFSDVSPEQAEGDYKRHIQT